ncbi:MAG: serine hydrolase domain-containing protein [Bacteroidota bacterium]
MKVPLEQPINKYVTDQNIPDSIKVKHVLSHTSQGEVGKHFYYSSRFSWLMKVIEKEIGGSFDSIVNASIVKPNGLHHTFLLKDTTNLIGKKVAKPYVFEGETKPGFIDYGYSSASGIVSTVRDIAKFGKLVEKIPEGKYNYGRFSQVVDGHQMLWAYGQYDCYSSLFIKIPDKDLIVVMAANNSLMSDPRKVDLW